MREQAVRSRLDEGEIAQPSEHVVSVFEPEGVADERLGGHARERARLQRAAALADRDHVDEPPQERGDEVGGQRVDLGLTAAGHHVGEQGQPERVAVGDLDETVVRGRLDSTGAQVTAALLRAEVAQRHHAQQVAPRGIAAPVRGRRLAGRHDRKGVHGQAGQQPGADPASRAPSRS